MWSIILIFLPKSLNIQLFLYTFFSARLSAQRSSRNGQSKTSKINWIVSEHSICEAQPARIDLDLRGDDKNPSDTFLLKTSFSVFPTSEVSGQVSLYSVTSSLARLGNQIINWAQKMCPFFNHVHFLLLRLFLAEPVGNCYRHRFMTNFL